MKNYLESFVRYALSMLAAYGLVWWMSPSGATWEQMQTTFVGVVAAIALFGSIRADVRISGKQ